jgi:hypothetical protein
MRSAQFIWIVTFCFLAIPILAQSSAPSVSGSTSSQGPSRWVPRPVRDPQAIQVVQASITALGGATAIALATDWTIQAQVQQSLGVKTPNGTVTWTVLGGEYRSDFSSPQGITTLASGHGKPFSVSQGTVTSAPLASMRALFSPALVGLVLLNEVQNSNYSVQSQGSSTIGSVKVNVVKTSSQSNPFDPKLTEQTWYFDSTTSFPVRVEFGLPDIKNPTRRVKSSLDFSGYSAIAGVSFPLQIVRSVTFNNNKQVSAFNVTSIKTNTGVAPGFFDAPAGGVQ